MGDSLDDLLSACSLASRSIRLLTAETKRRAVLLRGCCSEYEVALDKLSAASLDALRQDAQHELELGHDVAESAVQECGPSAASATLPDPCRHGEAGQGRLDGRDSASATAAMPMNVRGSSAEAAGGDRTAGVSSEHRRGQDLLSVDSYASEESLRITKSLEEILEQARSIRTSNGPQTVGGAGGVSGAAWSSRERATVATATASAAERAATPASRTSTVGARAKSAASSSVRIGIGDTRARAGIAPSGRHGSTAINQAPRAAVPATTTAARRVHSRAKAADAPPASRAPRRSHGSTSSSEVGQGHPVPGRSRFRAVSVSDTRPAGNSAQSTAAASIHSGGSTLTGRGKVRERSSGRVGAGRAGTSISPSTGNSGKPTHEQEQEQEVARAGAAAPAAGTGSVSTDVATNLEGGMWEEVARYESARRRFMFMGQNDSSSGSGSGTGDETAKSSRQHHDHEAAGVDAEKVLLRGLESGSGASVCGGRPQSQSPPLPDPQYFQWRELLLSENQVASEHHRDFHSCDPSGIGIGGASGVDVRYRGREGDTLNADGNSTRLREARNGVGLGVHEWEEIMRLQRSLEMLLDELEGRRELLAHEQQQRERDLATRGGSDGSGRGVDQALWELEEWYCWNKVAHVTGLVRERLDVVGRGITRGSCSGGGVGSSLSEEAKKLVENPSLALGGRRQNPLQNLSDTLQDCGWLSAWQQRSGVQPLRGTACLGVLQELQASAPSCWPHDSDPARGHTAELFAQHLRITSILAAETDVSRLVIPALARALSQASKASQARVEKSSADKASNLNQVDMRQQQVQQGATRARNTGRDAMLVGAGAGDAAAEVELDCLRERVPKRPVPASKNSCGLTDDDRVEEEMWAPALAVFRAVDAVVNGDGRSRISFVHRGSAGALD